MIVSYKNTQQLNTLHAGATLVARVYRVDSAERHFNGAIYFAIRGAGLVMQLRARAIVSIVL